MTIQGPNIDDANTYRSTVEDGGDGGAVVIGNETVTISAGQSLEDIATKLNETLSSLTPAGSAEYNEVFDELHVDSGGNEIFSNPEGFLGLVNANAYIDGRLDGRKSSFLKRREVFSR